MPSINLRKIRQLVPLSRLLDSLDCHPVVTNNGEDRYPCPMHRRPGRKGATLSVNGDVFKCFKCGAEGDVLDLYRIVYNMTLYDAALSLCWRFNVPVPWLRGRRFREPKSPNREEGR